MTSTVRFGHVALPARDPRQLATFYHEFLGLEPTMAGALPALGEFVFLSDRPDEEAQVVTFMSRPEARHVAFEVESLAALKALHAEARVRGIAIERVLDHGVTLSLYLRDPEGNVVEVFWPTGRVADGVYARPIDLDTIDRIDAAGGETSPR